MGFHNKLYELRKKSGFSQEELANRLNVSRQTVSKWEVGETTPELDKVIDIGNLFNVSMDELILEKEQEPVQAEQITDLQRMAGFFGPK